MAYIDSANIKGALYELQDTQARTDVGDLKSALDFNESIQHEIITNEENISVANGFYWELGRFTFGNGAVPSEVSAQNRIKTQYLDVSKFGTSFNISCVSGYAWSYVFCDSSKVTLQNETSRTSAKTITAPSGTKYIRCVLSRTDNENMSVTEGTNLILTINNGIYAGMSSLENSIDDVDEKADKALANADLIICGSDATDFQKAHADYICASTSEIYEDAINAIIDQYINKPITIKFCGTIRTAHGIHKHPKHNLDGYNCTLMMGDNLGTDYECCIRPTTGGVTYEQQQMVSHGYTYVKGFTFDGRCETNKNQSGNYSYKDIYGAVISGSIFVDEENTPPTMAQLCSEIILEDVTAKNTMRGIAPGFYWYCRNLNIGNAVTDHALYIPGSNGVIVDNVHITGTHKNAAICVSDAGWEVGTKTRDTRLRNLYFDECRAGILDIRGNSKKDQEHKATFCGGDVFIDNMYVKNLSNNISPSAIWIGSHSTNTDADTSEIDDYPTNIHINNLSIDAKMSGSPIVIYNAGVIMKNVQINCHYFATANSSLIRLQCVNVLKKAIDMSGLRIRFTEDTSTPIKIFGFNRDDSDNIQLNGLNINDLYVSGNDNNFYVFGVAGSNSRVITVTDIQMERAIGNPLAVIDPASSDYIVFGQQSYMSIPT